MPPSQELSAMAKKKKKKVVDKLAKKRGQRTAQSRLKRKRAPKVSKKASDLSAEQRQAAEVALLRSPLLLSSPELDPVHLDGDRVTEYLQDVRSRDLEDPKEFVSEGLRTLADNEVLSSVRMGLTKFIQNHQDESPESALSASLVLSLMERMEDLASIPFFALLFVREVKDHPLADDPVIWKLVSPYLPSRIVKPEEEAKQPEEKGAFEKSKEFPHIVVPKGYSNGEGGQT